MAEIIGARTDAGRIEDHVRRTMRAAPNAADGGTLGSFDDPVDLDPGADVDTHTGTSGGAFFSGVDRSGRYLYSREMETAPDLVAFDDTTVFILGAYPDQSDLEPGPAIDLHTEGAEFFTLALLRFAR